MTRTVN